jgi:hypothetical protein
MGSPKEDGMTVELEEFTEWRHSVEERLCKLKAASDRRGPDQRSRGHLVSMDEDLSKIQVEFRAQRGMLQALHDTQSEHIAVLREHTTLLTAHRTRLGSIETRLSGVEATLQKAHVGVDTILDLLKSAEGSNS